MSRFTYIINRTQFTKSIWLRSDGPCTWEVTSFGKNFTT